MGIKTKIEYADSTVNPIMGCSGCELYHPRAERNHCYAATLCNRYGGANKGFPETFDCPQHFPGRLEKAIKWKDLTGTDRPDKPWLDGYPRIIFVNDLSDGFCDDVDPSEWLGPCLHKMAQSPHIWLLLTKWPRAMGHFFPDGAPENFWLGTSVLRQRDEWRIKELLQIEASARFVSLEPLLSEIDIEEYLTEWLNPVSEFSSVMKVVRPALDWMIVGGESGPSARPMDAEWTRGIVDQCHDAGTPCFVKQMGTIWAVRNSPFDDRLTNVWQGGDTKGAKMEYWPEDLRVREMPEVAR